MRGPLRHRGNRRGAVGDGAHHEPRVRERLTQRLDCSDIPIDDQNLLLVSAAIIDAATLVEMQLYIALTLL